MDADDEEVDAAASSVGALHMNPFRSHGGAELARAPWSRHQATAAFAMHVGNALSLALGAEAGDKQHLMAVVLAVKKDGLVLPRSRQEGRPAHAPGQSAAVLSALSAVLLSHHRQHLNPARPLRQSKAAGTPAGWPPVPWCSPTAGIRLSIVGWCVWGDFKNQQGVDCSLLQNEIEFCETQPGVFLAV